MEETRSMLRASLDAAKAATEVPPTLCDRAECEFRVAIGCCDLASSCTLHCRCMSVCMVGYSLSHCVCGESETPEGRAQRA